MQSRRPELRRRARLSGGGLKKYGCWTTFGSDGRKGPGRGDGRKTLGRDVKREGNDSRKRLGGGGRKKFESGNPKR